MRDLISKMVIKRSGVKKGKRQVQTIQKQQEKKRNTKKKDEIYEIYERTRTHRDP